MIIPDANLLIYAHDSTSPRHAAAREYWQNALSSPTPIGIPWVVILAFTRIMTHPGICANPLSVAEARECVGQWLGAPHVRVLSPAADSVPAFFDLLEQAEMGGNLTTDALIALHASQHGATLVSNDRDFDRFPGLRRLNPLA